MFSPGNTLAKGVFVVVLIQIISPATGIYSTRTCCLLQLTYLHEFLIICAKITLSVFNLSFLLVCYEIELELKKLIIVREISKKSLEIRCEKDCGTFEH